jgi:hypothetical protein
MRILNRILIGLAIIAAALVVLSFLLPRHVTVARSIVIEAPPAKVFSEINSLQRFNAWSPWAEINPQAQYAFSGPAEGVGNVMTWTSDHPDLASGSQRIIRSEADQVVESLLEFVGSDIAKTRFRLESQGPRTIVTWSFETDIGTNPVMRYWGLVFDEQIGKTLRKRPQIAQEHRRRQTVIRP